MSAGITRGRLAAAAVVMLLAGLQLGLWLADWYDDGVHSPLSLAIGVAILLAGVALIVTPVVRRRP